MRAHQTDQPLHAFPVVGGAELRRGPGGSLDLVGHADAVAAQELPSVAVDVAQSRPVKRLPEAVRRPGEADAQVRGRQARVQSAHQQSHVGADRVGEGAQPGRPDQEAVQVVARAGHLEVVDGEAGAREQVLQLDRVPEGEASTGEVVVGTELALAGEHLECQDAIDPYDSMQVGEHHRQVGGRDVLEALVRPDAAERPTREGQRFLVDQREGHGLVSRARHAQHRQRGVASDERRADQVEVQAGPTAEVEASTLRRRGREVARRFRVTNASVRGVVICPGVVRGKGLGIHAGPGSRYRVRSAVPEHRRPHPVRSRSESGPEVVRGGPTLIGRCRAARSRRQPR